VLSGQVNLVGNVNLDAAIKAEKDIVIDGQNMNANDCVIYSVSGDIIIESDNVIKLLENWKRNEKTISRQTDFFFEEMIAKIRKEVNN